MILTTVMNPILQNQRKIQQLQPSQRLLQRLPQPLPQHRPQHRPQHLPQLKLQPQPQAQFMYFNVVGWIGWLGTLDAGVKVWLHMLIELFEPLLSLNWNFHGFSKFTTVAKQIGIFFTKINLWNLSHWRKYYALKSKTLTTVSLLETSNPIHLELISTRYYRAAPTSPIIYPMRGV